MRPLTLHEALVYGSGTERPFLCPVHGDSRPSASVNVIKQKWICYTCGARGGLTGEAACMEPDAEVLKTWLLSKFEENHVYPESWLNRWDAGATHPYWADRVGNVAAEHFRLGYDSEREAGTYPLRGAQGEVLGVVRRRLLHGDGPKYRYPTGVDVGRLLFNYSPEHRKQVVLCEGALDAIALWRAGITAFAIYGARLSADQVALIDRIDPDVIYTAYDHDDAGWGAHVETRRALRHCRVERLTWPMSWGKDVDELGLDRLSKVTASLDRDHRSAVGSCSWESVKSSPRTSKPRRLRITPTAA